MILESITPGPLDKEGNHRDDCPHNRNGNPPGKSGSFAGSLCCEHGAVRDERSLRDFGCLCFFAHRFRRRENGNWHLIDSRNKPVPLPRHGFDITRCIRLIGQRGPKLPDASVQPGIELHGNVVTPELTLYVLSRDHFTGALQQHH